jgi:hypothetical protein
MRGGEDGVSGSHGLGRFDPLVGVELGRIVDLRIPRLMNGVVVGAPASGEQWHVKVEDRADFAVLPNHLPRQRHGQASSLVSGHGAKGMGAEQNRARRHGQRVTSRQ